MKTSLSLGIFARRVFSFLMLRWLILSLQMSTTLDQNFVYTPPPLEILTILPRMFNSFMLYNF